MDGGPTTRSMMARTSLVLDRCFKDGIASTLSRYHSCPCHILTTMLHVGLMRLPLPVPITPGKGSSASRSHGTRVSGRGHMRSGRGSEARVGSHTAAKSPNKMNLATLGFHLWFHCFYVPAPVFPKMALRIRHRIEPPQKKVCLIQLVSEKVRPY